MQRVKNNVFPNESIYDLQGRQLKSSTMDINNIRQSDGTKRKVMVK